MAAWITDPAIQQITTQGAQREPRPFLFGHAMIAVSAAGLLALWLPAASAEMIMVLS
jgi:hypothetical protein